MLSVLADLSYQSDMDVRIIVGSNSAADKIRKLVEAGFKETVFRVQGNIHNKGIVVDGKIVLVSSANWSSDGVLRNRDAGLIIHDEEIAGYYQQVFLDDWESRARATLDDDPRVIVATDDAVTPAGMVRMSWRDYYG
jgi:phosphatidylserine/phosphatidylglycerophosphate/cardiolipin synthase-like enzyme